MNVWIASDIHGSALYCRKLLDLMEKRGADRLVLLGDLLYHGPRNDLPEGYDPKAVFAMRPSRTLLDGAGYVVYGHFHVPMRRLEDGVWYWNPGSVSIPKENSWHGCMRMTEDAVQWLDLDGNLKDELR